METLAGVFLIITGILNFFAGAAYTTRGKMTAGAANLGENATSAVEKVAESEGIVINQDSSAAVSKGFDAAKKDGSKFKLLGGFLYLSTALLIAGAVFLFQGTYGQYVLAAGIIAIVAELLGIAASKFGVSNAPGLIGGVLTVYVSLPLI